ncbi:MAG: hypothetical protein IKM02_02180 [Clostridia bacterium]|nr:hypothetical protein [Clostridia bacterium]
MNLLNKVKNILTIMLMLCILIGTLPAAVAEGSFKAVVTANKMKVYAASSSHKYLGSLPKGTVVTVNAYSKGIAKISYKGKTGLAYVNNMEAVEEKNDEAENQSPVPAVASQKIRIYKKASTSSKYVSVAKGTEMNVLAVSGKFAKVEKDGNVGYALKKYLADPDTLKAEEEKEEADSPATPIAVQVLTDRSTRIYKKATTSSAYTTVPKGTEMTMTGLSGECARVELNGVVGYAVRSHLIKKSEAIVETPSDKTPADTDKKEESADKKDESAASSNPIFNSGKSNEEITYLFLTKVMGYNTAAAVGVMANIKYESGYKPVSNGDSGSSYGICQWHAGRKTRLINWCDENGYDHATLEGQLYYLKHDLTNSYTKVHKYLSAVENTAEGAYDAGYYFCYHFESPSSKATKSITRGEYARDTLWARYNK